MRLKILAALLLLLSAIEVAVAEKPVIVVTVSDLKPIVESVAGNYYDVRSLLPPGSDPHHFSLSGEDVEMLKKAEIIVLANSDLLSFERKIKEEFPDRVLDFPDYHAKLEDFPGYKKNPHGYWLEPENAVAIARAVAKRISENHPEMKEEVDLRLKLFREDVEDAAREARNIVGDLRGEKFVAMVPGVCYIASSLNLTVAAVMLSEGSGFVSGSELEKIKDGLKSGEYEGIIVPEFMKGTKGGEVAEQLCSDAGCRVAYVKFSTGDSYVATLIVNAARISYSEIPEKPERPYLLYLLASLCLLQATAFFFWRTRS